MERSHRTGMRFNAADDTLLLSRIAQGDDQALAALYERYAGAVYGLALRRLRAADLAEDIVQETFWRVWRRSQTFQPERGTATSWLLQIANNLCLDELRREQRRPQPSYTTDDQPILELLADERQETSAPVLTAEQNKTLIHALGKLPDKQREVIQLGYAGGLSQREIAKRLDQPLGTVKTRMRLGLKQLRTLLTSYECV